MTSGGRLAPLDDALKTELDGMLPANWSRANPIDIIGDARPDRYAAVMGAVLARDKDQPILVLNCPTALASSSEAAAAVIDAVAGAHKNGGVPPILTSWLGEAAATEARAKFRAAQIPTYETPNQAIEGFGYLWQYTQGQEALMRTPPREADLSQIDRAAAQQVMAGAVKAGRTMLTEPEAKAVLTAYGIPTVPTRVARTAAEVEEAAADSARGCGARSWSRCCRRMCRINPMSAG